MTGRNVPGADMQRHVMRAMPRASKRREQLVGEMQARGRRGDRAFLAREDRLVVGAVALVGRRGGAM